MQIFVKITLKVDSAKEEIAHQRHPDYQVVSQDIAVPRTRYLELHARVIAKVISY